MPILWFCLEADALTEEQRSKVKALAPEMDVVVSREPSEYEPMLEDVEIAAGWIEPQMVMAMPNVRWVQHWAAGVDSLVGSPEIVERDFVLTNGSGVHGIPISEHIFAFLLALARGLPCAIRAQTERRWVSPPPPCGNHVFELYDQTMVLIGVGAIGSRTAEVAAALGMRVVGIRRDPSEDEVPGVAEMMGPEKLNDVLPDADVVVLTVPLTDETENMIDVSELRRMKTSAVLVNIGRGGTVNEDALVRALEEGWIRSAGLDVFEMEPLPEDSPLWGFENVIITPHYAGHNPHYNERAMGIFLDNLRRYHAGDPMRNVVDQVLGY